MEKLNKGAIFRNTKKQNERQPDHSGICNVAGTEYYIAAWVKESKGTKYFSLAFTPKEVQDQISQTDDQDVPF